MSAPIADLECVATLPFHLRRARPNSYSKPTSRELTAYVGVFLEHGRHALAGVRSGGATGDRSRGPPWCMVCCVCVGGQLYSVSREPWQHDIYLRAESCEAVRTQYHLGCILPTVDLREYPVVLVGRSDPVPRFPSTKP